jgi:hypothetical protein
MHACSLSHTRDNVCNLVIPSLAFLLLNGKINKRSMNPRQTAKTIIEQTMLHPCMLTPILTRGATPRTSTRTRMRALIYGRSVRLHKRWRAQTNTAVHKAHSRSHFTTRIRTNTRAHTHTCTCKRTQCTRARTHPMHEHQHMHTACTHPHETHAHAHMNARTQTRANARDGCCLSTSL